MADTKLTVAPKQDSGGNASAHRLAWLFPKHIKIMPSIMTFMAKRYQSLYILHSVITPRFLSTQTIQMMYIETSLKLFSLPRRLALLACVIVPNSNLLAHIIATLNNGHDSTLPCLYTTGILIPQPIYPEAVDQTVWDRRTCFPSSSSRYPHSGHG